jgi:outer membrane lipoprotein
MNAKQKIFLLSLAFMISGCGHVISENLRKEADPALTFREVFSNPSAYRGKQVIWGGEIIETVNQKEGSTLIEVLQRPLTLMGEPRENAGTEGRFMILIENYLDPYIYKTGRKITVAGEVAGEKVKPVGEMDYRYPLLVSRQIHLWEDPQLYSYPYPYFYGGWYYRPFYPRWSYPYRYYRVK